MSCYTLHEEVLASRQINILRDFRDAIIAFLIVPWMNQRVFLYVAFNFLPKGRGVQPSFGL